MSEVQEPHNYEHPAQPDPVLPEMNYEQSIAWSQGIKRQIVAKKIQGGVPSDNDEIKVLLEALKAHDSTALNDRKNRNDEHANQSSAEIAHAMVEMVKQQKNENPFSVRAADGSLEAPVADHVPRAILPKVDEDKLGQHDLVDGEGEIGTVQETSETFFNRMGMGNKKES